MAHKPEKAFIMAAGHGHRMRPLTDTLPKPMVPIANRPMIDYIIDKLVSEGIQHIIVNTHHLSEVIEKHLSFYSCPQIKISHENELLNTGGGTRKILDFIGEDIFYHISGDSFWTEGTGKTALARLAEAWDGQKMDILMLLQPVDTMTITQGVGDYDILPDGKAVRSLTKTGKYMFTSIRITCPRIFSGVNDTVFSFLRLMDEAEKRGRLYAIIHEGQWHHVSTPQDVDAINTILNNALEEKL